MMMMRSALYQISTLSSIFNSVSSLKQQSADIHVAPIGHIILIPSQPVFALSPEYCMFSGDETNTNYIVFGLMRQGLEPTIYRTRNEHANHYTTYDAVMSQTRSYYSLLTIQFVLIMFRIKPQRNRSSQQRYSPSYIYKCM